MIGITLNGNYLRLKKGITVLEAARDAGIHIPHFCDHPLLEKFGGCRICLVEVEKSPKLQASCTLTATDGMVIRTESPAVVKARKAMLEFLLINHPLDCPTCDKAGECRLQNYAMLYGAEEGRFSEHKRKVPEALEDPLIVRNMERCIVCQRCVRMCGGVQGAAAISVVGRGGHSHIEPFSGGRFDCDYCGNCIVVCPVGSLMSRLHRHAYRPWQVDREVQSVCPYCGVGCSMVLQVREESISRVMPRPGMGTNNGVLCGMGFFGYEYVSSPERLTEPLLRKNGKLTPVPWEEALDALALRLLDNMKAYGPDSFAGIASARCTNEDNYLFQKVMRAGLKTNSVDSIARMGYAAAQRVIEDILGPGATANVISGISRSDAVLVVGGDPTRINPVLGIQVRAAHGGGAKVVALGYNPGLRYHITARVSHEPGEEGMVLGALLSGLLKRRRIPEKTPELREALLSMDLPGAGETSHSSGIADAVEALAVSPSVSIIFGGELAARPDGVSNLILLAALAYLLQARIYLMSERPNEQGAVDAGCAPDALPGWVPLADPEARKLLEDLWHAALPDREGLSLMEMMEAAHARKIKTMYVMGENPAFNLPDSSFCQEALRRLDFLVVQDIFLTETARMADVVLPALGWAEKDGTYTNLERRIQRLRKAVRGRGMEDWRILASLGRRLGVRMPYESAKDVMGEMAQASPLHSGVTHELVESGKCLWPYLSKPAIRPSPAGTLKLYRRPSARAGEELSICLDKPLFHSGTLSRHSPALNSVYPHAVASMNPLTAKGFSLAEGDLAEVSTGRGSLAFPVRLDDEIPAGKIFLSNHFKSTGVFFLYEYNIVSFLKAPVLISSDVDMRKRT